LLYIFRPDNLNIFSVVYAIRRFGHFAKIEMESPLEKAQEKQAKFLESNQ